MPDYRPTQGEPDRRRQNTKRQRYKDSFFPDRRTDFVPLSLFSARPIPPIQIRTSDTRTMKKKPV